MTGRATDLHHDGFTRRLDEIIRLLRRIECHLASKPIPDELKELTFDEVAPNGRLT